MEGQLAKYIKASQVGSGILDPIKRLIKKFRVPAGKLATGMKNAVKDFAKEHLSERKLKKYGSMLGKALVTAAIVAAAGYGGKKGYDKYQDSRVRKRDLELLDTTWKTDSDDFDFDDETIGNESGLP